MTKTRVLDEARDRKQHAHYATLQFVVPSFLVAPPLASSLRPSAHFTMTLVLAVSVTWTFYLLTCDPTFSDAHPSP